MTEQERTGLWLLAGYTLLEQATSIPKTQLSENEVVFRDLLRSRYKNKIRTWINTFYLPWLRQRGLPATSTDEDIDAAIEASIEDTDDMLETVRNLTAAFPRDQWRSAKHQALVLRDLARRTADRIETQLIRTFVRTPGLTGNKRWNTTHPESRHADLNGKQTRNTWAYKGERITGPRHNPANPSEWSGCACYVEYEWRDEQGSTGWI